MTRKTSALLLAACCLAPAAMAQRVEFILDGSGSMWGEAGGEAKIVAAKRAMVDLLSGIELPSSATLGLTIYGHRAKGDCADIEHFSAVGYAERSELVPLIEGIQPKGKTPIADSLRIVGESLKGKEESSSIVLVSDGIESCGKDPCEVARQLREAYGINVVIHVVGFDVREGQEQLQCIAKAGGGEFRSADNATELSEALGSIGTAVAESAKPKRVSTEASPVSAILVEPLALEGFPSMQAYFVLPAGWRTDYHAIRSKAKTNMGQSLFVQPGDYDVLYQPSETGNPSKATYMVRGLEVEPQQKVTLHTNELVAGVVVKPLQGITPKRIYVYDAGRRRDLVDSAFTAACDGYDKVMVVPAGISFDVLLYIDDTSGLVPIKEDATFEPGELLVIGGEG